MKRKKISLNVQLMIFVTGVAVVLLAVSGALVTGIVVRQHQSAAKDLMQRAAVILQNELAARAAALSLHTKHLSEQGEKGTQILFLQDYKENPDYHMTKGPYEEIAKNLFDVATAGKLAEGMVFDKAGDLVAVVTTRGNTAVLVYPRRENGSMAYMTATFSPGEALSEEAWTVVETPPINWKKPPPEMIPQTKGEIPEEVIRYEIGGGEIALTAYAPVTAQVFDMETGDFKPGFAGTVRTSQRLGPDFIDRMSNYTGAILRYVLPERDLDIVFDDIRFSQTVGAARATARPRWVRDSVHMGDDAYYAAVVLLGSPAPVGGIAALHAKQAVRKKTMEMVHLLAWVALACLAGVLPPLVLLFSRYASRPIRRAISDVNRFAAEVAASSKAVAEGGRVLARETGDQAAFLEETSASLEEVAASVSANAEGAGRAREFMEAVKTAVDETERAMHELDGSMQAMIEASESAVGIVKGIEDIAFQTNLLSLNAAVEAARAGEAGAGFLVVAEEVKKLAAQSADASRKTAQLIADSGKKVTGGRETAEKTHMAFQRVTEAAKEAMRNVDDIAVASKEQSRGVEQIRQAVVTMDQSVQETAGRAESLAEVSAVMEEGAVRTRDSVFLLEMVVGSRKETVRHRGKPSIFKRGRPSS